MEQKKDGQEQESVPATSPPSSVLEFLRICGQLKTTKRTGWVIKGIQNPESIADHMYRMGIMALLCNDPGIDRDRCVKMAVVHDLAESIVGDITPISDISKEEKHRREEEAMTKLCKTVLQSTPQSLEIYSLWNEYEEGETPEAIFVKDLDKFEMIMQATEYEESDKKVLDEFFDRTRGKFRHPLVKSWVEELYLERRKIATRSNPQLRNGDYSTK